MKRLLADNAALPGLLVVMAACSGMDREVTLPAPPEVSSIEPAIGTVDGGTFVTIRGAHLDQVAITIGGIECSDVASGASVASCRTGSSSLLEGTHDVVVSNVIGADTLPAAYTYECLWTTTTGRRSCGAVPPLRVPSQQVAKWVTTFQPGHGFIANPGPHDLADSIDFTLGDQSVFVTTDGAGTQRTLTRIGAAPIDFTGHSPKLWLKVDGEAHVSALELRLGNANLASHFAFELESHQGQDWITDGDWVAFTLSWSKARIAGTPDRAAITDVQLVVVDDGTGSVTLHANGLGLVTPPPAAAVTFTFDDNFASMYYEGTRALSARGLPATAYVIVDLVGTPGRTSLPQLETLQALGWDIAAHSFTDAHHAAAFPTLTTVEVEDDLVDARAWLIANRLFGYDHCAYPGGEFSAGVLAIVDRYFTSCRTSYRHPELAPPSDTRKLRVFYVTDVTTLAEATAAVDAAAENREWLIFVFHALVPVPTVATEWRSADFEALVGHVEASGLPVMSVADVLESR